MSKPQIRRTEGKFTETSSVANVFSKIFGFWEEEIGNLAENYWQGCQSYFLLVRRSTFEATFWKQVFKHFKFFWLLMNVPWQQRKFFIRVDKTAKNVSRSKLRKKLFGKKKIYYSFFQDFERTFFKILSNIYRAGYQNRNPCSFRRFWGQTFLWKNAQCLNLIRTLRWKK